ncbi:Alcohol oxidase [Mycena venus]|uniref:Alcohol oxidase n=1 Tax=Mycena venus TaxID=2733690 RepID=A0A8H6XNB8_9AGAR|nr:Alcohol oxidase [Mycena venus]
MKPSASEYDIIFAGGGTTACVVAGRLATADSSLRILILENGRSTKDNPAHVQPGRFIENITTRGSEILTLHSSKPGINLDGRAPVASNANCMGGGSSINGLMYNRAPASDYDDWMQLGNPGWGSADLIPLAKKLETYQAGVVDATHGSSGPIKVSHGGYDTEVGKDFLAAAAGFPRGRSFTEDLNDFSTCNVYGRLPQFIDAETGRRSDTAHAYIYNQVHNENLHILNHARVNRVLFDEEKRAVGVEYQADGRDGAMLTAHASRLVVISAGAFCSPAILERSGIGARDILEKYAIPVVAELPGVGENYQDHHAVFPRYLAPENTVTIATLAQDKDGAFEAQWRQNGKGLLAATGLGVGIKLRPNEQDLEQLTPKFAARWESFFANFPGRPMVTICPLAGDILGNSAGIPIYNVIYYAAYPISAGYVHIRSADPFTPLEVESALLDRDEDLLVMRWAYKWSRELARRMDCYRGETIVGHPQFPGGSEAKCGAAAGPVELSAPEIQYTESDNEAIDAFHRAAACLAWHSLGTCAMRPQEESGVVDPRLNVYGVRNMKVADLSIAPLNVGANTYHTALLIGEKAAIIIAEELGISV